VSLWLTTRADRFGRRRTLLVGAALMLAAGAVFALTRNPLLLFAAAVLGVISPSGYEIGPFLPVEQAALSHLVPDARRTAVFAWYNLAGSLATAVGSLCGGLLATGLQRGAGLTALASHRAVLGVYAGAGALLALLFASLTPAVEAPRADAAPPRRLLGLHRSRGVVLRLGALFSLDAFGGGFVVQSLVAWWFHRRFGADEAQLGALLFGANLLAALSSLLAARIAGRIGLVRTMVFTHLPSNVLLALVPFMPSFGAAVGLLLVRYSISQMDVPTRQSYVMAVVDPDERSAAAGVTNIARSIGAAISPALSGLFMAVPGAAPFVLAGGLKIIYDVLLYRSFRAVLPTEERVRGG
jgi:predicted MFS family arabinose efflux permease